MPKPSRRILYVQYVNPGMYPPLEHSSRILADAGWEVLFLGIDALGEAARLVFPPHPRIKVRSLGYVAPGWRQKLHYLAFATWVVFQVCWWRPKWVYVSDPLASPVAWLLQRLGTPVLYHEHDNPAPGGNRRSWWQRARTAAGRAAKIVVFPNRRRAEAFASQVGRAEPVLCVWNCPRLDEVGSPREPAAGTLRLLYHGSIVRQRLPPSIIEALASLPERVVLRIVGYETIGGFGYIEELRALAARLGVERRVEFRPACPRFELWRALDDCDVGLAFMPAHTDDINMSSMIGASNKAFDYLAAGLPLLVSDQDDWLVAYVQPGYAKACRPELPESVAAAIQWFADHPVELRVMGEAGRRQVQNYWNYEAQFEPVRQLLEAS